MWRPGWAFCVEALLLLLALPRAGGAAAFFSRRSLQVLTDGETVLNGVLNLFTEEGVAACEASCEDAFATAFGIEEVSVGCVCPISIDDSNADRRRKLMGNKQPTSSGAEQNNNSDQGSLRGLRRRRWLQETDSGQPVAFSARVAGGLAGGAAAVDLLSESGWSAVASAFGVDEDEVCAGVDRRRCAAERYIPRIERAGHSFENRLLAKKSVEEELNFFLRENVRTEIETNMLGAMMR